MLFPETDKGIGKEQNKDDEEIWPVTDNARENYSRFDHPRNRPPEIRQEFEKEIFLLHRQFIGAVLREALLRLIISQTFGCGVELLFHFRHGK